MEIGALVRGARKAAGLTQVQLARRAGLSRRAIVLLEGGGGRVTSFQAVHQALGMRLTRLPRAQCIGEQVKLLRLRRGLSQTQLAARCGISVPTLREVESGGGLVTSLSAVLKILAPETRQRSHPKTTWSSGVVERFTPPAWLEAIEKTFGLIDIDPCYDPRSFVNAKTSLTKENDGLTTSWSGKIAFVNPPYDGNSTWIKRCADAWESGEVSTIVALLPARVETAAFHDRVLTSASVILLRGKPRFYDAEQRQMSIAPFAALFAIWGGTRAQALEFAQLVNGRCIIAVRASASLETD